MEGFNDLPPLAEKGVVVVVVATNEGFGKVPSSTNDVTPTDSGFFLRQAHAWEKPTTCWVEAACGTGDWAVVAWRFGVRRGDLGRRHGEGSTPNAEDKCRRMDVSLLLVVRR